MLSSFSRLEMSARYSNRCTKNEASGFSLNIPTLILQNHYYSFEELRIEREVHYEFEFRVHRKHAIVQTIQGAHLPKHP